jgi:O-antigen ligase
VACESVATPPVAIGTTDELAAYGCRHINLEDIEREREAGYLVTEIDRRDPNIALRGQIYVTVSEVVQSHPFLGIGWGSISSILGTDERGAGLNASNIFLEVWLGSGLLGLAALVVLLSYFSLRLLQGVMGASMTEEAMLAASLLSILLGLTVCNLFNSGILLGFYFMFFAVAALLVERAISSPSQL